MLISSLITSTLVAALFGVPWLWFESQSTWPLFGAVAAFVITLAHIWLLGIPSVMLLRKIGFLNWCSVLASGFLIGCLSYAAFSYFVSPSTNYSSSAWNGGEMALLVSNGTITQAGWRLHAISAAQVGAIGLLVSAIFFAILRRHRGSNLCGA